MNPNTEFLGDKESLQQLESLIEPAREREAYLKYGHQRFESAFDGRLLIVYSPRGVNTNGTHRDPEIHTTIKVLGFDCNSHDGASVRLSDLTTGEEQTITYVPSRVFDYDVFMSVPPFMRLRWDAKPTQGGVKRSMSYALLVKCRNRSDWFSAGNTYVETPNKIRTLFPDFDLQLRYA